jgi:hypothetical protein
MTREWVRIRKDAVVAYLKVLSRRSPGETEEMHKTSESEQPRFELDTAQIQVSNVVDLFSSTGMTKENREKPTRSWSILEQAGPEYISQRLYVG